jgi:hypothetical protein
VPDGFGVDVREADFDILGPERHQAPTVETAKGVFRVRDDEPTRAGGGDNAPDAVGGDRGVPAQTRDRNHSGAAQHR